MDDSRRALVLTDETDPELLIHLLRMGFAGCLQRDCSSQTVRKAIEAVEAGEIWASRMVMSGALRSVTSILHEGKLTAREIEVLDRIAIGHDNRRIAEELFITRETVRWHIRNAYSKLGVHDRTIAARLGSH